MNGKKDILFYVSIKVYGELERHIDSYKRDWDVLVLKYTLALYTALTNKILAQRRCSHKSI